MVQTALFHKQIILVILQGYTTLSDASVSQEWEGDN